MKLTYKEIDYKNFGKCLQISNGTIDIIVTLDIGPRIIRFGYVGKENMFFEDIERHSQYSGEEFKYIYGEDKVWYNYGGHRLWISPEYPETYYPDNDPIVCEKLENGVWLKADVQAVTGLRLSIKVEFVGIDELKVSHYVTNESGETQDYSLWALTVLDPGGVEIFRHNDSDTGLLPNRVFQFWPYSKLNDERLYYGENFISMRQDKNITRPYKIGLDNEYGTALYINHGCMFKKTYTHYLGGVYPDEDCSFETYTNQYFLECESLSEFGPKPDGSTTVHVENWKLYDGVIIKNPCDEAELKKIWDKAQ